MKKPICDFCSSKSITWAYPCNDFSVTVFMMKKSGELASFEWGSQGGWAACEECSALVEAGEWDALAQRGVDTSPSLRILRDHYIDGEVKKAILGLHVEFRHNRMTETRILA